MTDLVTRLRECSDEFFREDPRKYIGNLLREAADALEKANSHLLDAANNCVRQDTLIGSLYSKRDALKAKLVKAEERFEKLLDQAAGEIAELKAKLAEALARLDAVRAEAAAYRHMLKIALGCIDFDENRATVKEICEALSQRGPGAALLERLESEKTRADLAEERADKLVDKNDALLERVRKLEAVAEIVKSYFWARDRTDLHQALAALEDKP